MSWFQWIADLAGVTKQLTRIADALERAYPPPSPVVDPTEAEDITYATDEATALQEMKDLLKKRGELSEEEDVLPEDR